ncbi:MAG: type II toxin-antitoxin system RelE/ParE family toxin [Synergistaceae bacterium]|nr:type II toxin-antitoxin system RelE/ParE family toxin [Synergistaceae bacterium]
MQYTVVHYEENGRDIFGNWLKKLKDKRGQSAIYRVVDRLEEGNFGEHRFCRNGVWELVVNYGPGYRVYYSIIDKFIVLLLCAGDKSTQQKDINQAVDFLKRYEEEQK